MTNSCSYAIFWWNSCSFSDLLTELPFFLRSFEGIPVFSAIFWRYSCFFRDLLEEILFFARFFFYHDTLTEFLFLPRFFEAIGVFIAILWRNSSDLRPFFKWWNSRFISRSFDEIIDFSVGLQRRFFSHDSLIKFASFQRPTGEIPRVYAILCQNLYIYPFSTNDWRNRFFSCTSCRNSLWQSSEHNWSLLAVEEFLRTFIFKIFQSVNWWTTVKINCWRIIIWIYETIHCF